MTATNHLLAGAAMAAGLQQPFLIVPLAFASHFVLDMLPHFGVGVRDTKIRNKHPLFQYIVIVDTALAVTLFAFLPFLAGDGINPWVLVLGMICAWLPDALWVGHFVHHLRGRAARLGRFALFHQRIQWFERPIGLVVELVWFAGMGVFLGYLLA